jgi:hypothetical protein
MLIAWKRRFSASEDHSPPRSAVPSGGIDDIIVLSLVPATEGADVHGNRDLFGIDALELGGGNPLSLFRWNRSPIDKA